MDSDQPGTTVIPQVLLVGNYEPDGQFSMQAYGALLMRELTARGVDVEMIRPVPVFGRRWTTTSGVGKWLGYVDKYLLFPREMRKHVRRCLKNGPVVVHVCDQGNSIYVATCEGAPCLVTCHDLVAIRSARGELPGNKVRFAGRLLQSRILAGLEKADLVACVSEATRSDLVALGRRDPGRTLTILSGLNWQYSRMDKDKAMKVVEKLGVPQNRRVILHVGSDLWYKNRDGLLRIYAKARAGHGGTPPCLVIAGDPLSRRHRDFIAKHGLAGDIMVTGPLEPVQLAALYSSSDVFLFPSRYEGFGWPPLEAQACGCPVVASRNGSLGEVLGDSAITADADDEDELVGGVLRLLDDPSARESAVRDGLRNVERLTVKAMIDGYMELYGRMAKSETAGA